MNHGRGTSAIGHIAFWRVRPRRRRRSVDRHSFEVSRARSPRKSETACVSRIRERRESMSRLPAVRRSADKRLFGRTRPSSSGEIRLRQGASHRSVELHPSVRGVERSGRSEIGLPRRARTPVGGFLRWSPFLSAKASRSEAAPLRPLGAPRPVFRPRSRRLRR